MFKVSFWPATKTFALDETEEIFEWLYYECEIPFAEAGSIEAWCEGARAGDIYESNDVYIECVED